MKPPDRTLPPQIRLDLAIDRVMDHLSRGRLNWRQRQHLKQWTMEAAHAVYEMHPELREDYSLPRYFVAREGRRKGLRGPDLTRFIDTEYQQGTWWKLVPEEVLVPSQGVPVRST